MTELVRATGAIGLLSDDRHGPLPALLLVLTLISGLVDAVGFIKLGHVFVANMTGNVAFLGLAVADTQSFSIPASLSAVAAFFLGALVGGRLGASAGHHRGRHLALAIYAEIALFIAALVVATIASDTVGIFVQYALIVLLASAMGLQGATARRLGVPDLTTTVLTTTLTGLAADSRLAGGTNSNAGRRMLAIFTMFLGAAIGAAAVLHAGIGAALALVLALLVLNGIAAYRASSSQDAWTVGT